MVRLLGVYTALGGRLRDRRWTPILAVVRELTEHGVTQAELDRAREQSKANVLMGLESTQSHMSSLGRGELLQGEVLDEDAIIAAYDAVTRADVQALAGELFRFENAPFRWQWGAPTPTGRRCTEIKLKTGDLP